jgi:hypothetical protein
MTTLQITKRYERLYRSDDGSATYVGVDADGTEILIIRPDGTRFSSTVVGWCFHCLGGSCGRPECPRDWSVDLDSPAPVAAPLPVTELARDDHVSDPVSGSEPVSAPAPERDPLPRTGPVRLMPAGERLAPVEESVPDVKKDPGQAGSHVAASGGLQPVPVEPVSELVSSGARQIASAVWERGELSKAVLFYRTAADSAERRLAHAVAMQWVVVDGNQVKKGPVNPVPTEPALSYREARTRWGPDWVG